MIDYGAMLQPHSTSTHITITYAITYVMAYAIIYATVTVTVTYVTEYILFSVF